MEGNLPTPTMRFFRRKTCVLMPFFVKELVRTIRQIAPGQCRDRINHLPKSGLRPLDLVKRISERFLRPLAFDGDASDVTCAFYEREVFFGGNSRLVSHCGSRARDIARASFAPWRHRGQSPVPSKMLQSRIDLLRKQPALA